MSTIKEIIDGLIANSADASAFNSFLQSKKTDENGTTKPFKKERRRGKKNDPKKEIKVMIDRFIMNLDVDDEDDLDDLIAFMSCYISDEFGNENYFNSTLVLTIRSLIAFKYYIEIDSIINLIEKVANNDRVKANTIDVFIDYLDTYCDHMETENMNLSIIVIHSNIIANNLWISEVSYVKLIELMRKFIGMNLHKNNLIMTTILTCIDTIIKRYPYFENIETRTIIDSLIKECTDNKLTGLDCNYDKMGSDLTAIVYHNVITKVYRNSGVDELGCYNSFVEKMNKGKTLIIDGKNIFHDTSGKERKYINIKGLTKFIKDERDKKYSEREYNRIYVVFYCEHYKVLMENLKELIESNDNYSSIKFCDNLYIVLSPMKQNDDVLTLHLWLSRAGNYILTKDNFTDHAKTFHSNTYLYELWSYYYSRMLVNKY